MIIKYRNGTFTRDSIAAFLAGGNITASQVCQVLEQTQDQFKAKLGDYKWVLDGDTYHGYRIVAHWGGQAWVDAAGKTPREALVNLCRKAGIEVSLPTERK